MNSNYYDILGCDSSATYDEIKRCYQELVKLNHPDKQKQLNKCELQGKSDNTFVAINKAWKVLRDENLRQEYDKSLLQRTIDDTSIIYAELKADDLHFQEEIARFICRCGATIEISRQDFLKPAKQDELFYDCVECSNTIKVSK